MTKILIIEDSIETQIYLKEILRSFEVHCAANLKDARGLLELSPNKWDLIILDRSLPDGDGVDLCLELHKAQINRQSPILMLTSKNAVNDKVDGLTAGADDYVVKPFEPRELLARIETLLRRRSPVNEVTSIIHFANLTVNLEAQSVFITKGPSQNISADLTPIEFKILLHLIKNYGKELGRDELVQIMWDKTSLSKRNIDTHICHLRKKLSDSLIAIKNRRGKGYFIDKIESPEQPTAAAVRDADLPSLNKGIGNLAQTIS